MLVEFRGRELLPKQINALTDSRQDELSEERREDGLAQEQPDLGSLVVGLSIGFPCCQNTCSFPSLT